MIIDEAKKDPRLAKLLKETEGKFKIKYRASDTLDWGSNIVGNTLWVYHQKTGHPGASFAHELLHAQIQLQGYRRVRIGVYSEDQTDRFTNLMTCLDNELQHHKMYPKFIELGFPKEEFYSDDDSNTFLYLEEVVRHKHYGNILDVLPHFFTLLAPGGGFTDQQKEILHKGFLSLNGGAYAPKLCAIQSAIEDWKNSDSYDAIPTWRSIFLTLSNPCYAWFGFSNNDRPPDKGFFVDKSFQVEA